MKAVILDGACASQKDLNFDGLSKLCDTVYYDRTPKELVVTRLKGVDIAVTNKVPIGKDVIDSCPDLKYITVLATGYDIIDCAYAKLKGITVSNVPSYSTDSVVQHTFALLLEVTSKVAEHALGVKNGEWSSNTDFCLLKSEITELSGKTFGIIGYGAIGQKVKTVAEAFGMKVIFCTRTPKTGCVSLEEVLRSSDIISLHCPKTVQNAQFINVDSIAKMKDGVILINTARGGLIDENALFNALQNGKIAYFAADVLSKEPPDKDNPLLTAPNAVITSHVAWASKEARDRLIKATCDNIAAYVNGSPINVVNA